MKISESDLQLLGISSRDLQYNLQSPDPEECRRRLEEMKKRVKKNFRALALKMHPDRNPDADQELFKHASAVYDSLMKLEIRTRPRPQPVRHARVWTTSSTSSTTSSSWGGGGFTTWTIRF